MSAALAPHLGDCRGAAGAGRDHPARLGAGGPPGVGGRDRAPGTSTWSRSTTAPARWPGSASSTPSSRPHGSTVGRCPSPAWTACCRGPRASWWACRHRRRSRRRTLLAAYEQADADGFEGTDTASCVERYAPDVTIAAVAGSAAQPQGDLPRGRRASGSAWSARLARRRRRPRRPGAPRWAPRPAPPGTGASRASTSAAKSVDGRPSSSATTAAGSTTGEQTVTSAFAVDGVPEPVALELLDGVGHRAYADHDRAGRHRLGEALRDESRWRHRAERVVQHERLLRGLEPRPLRAEVNRGHAGVTQPPDRGGHQRLAVDQRERQRAAALLDHGAECGGGTSYAAVVMATSPDALDLETGRCGRPPGARPGATVRSFSWRGPRRGSPRPCPRWCARPERARRPGSAAPSRASASRRRRARGHARGATGRGLPRRPS